MFALAMTSGRTGGEREWVRLLIRQVEAIRARVGKCFFAAAGRTPIEALLFPFTQRRQGAKMPRQASAAIARRAAPWRSRSHGYPGLPRGLTPARNDEIEMFFAPLRLCVS
jgi:hypothetical protein